MVLLGPVGSFSDATVRSAALKKFIKGRRVRFVPSIAGIFSGVNKGALGLVPLRNKIIGRVPGSEPYFKAPQKWEVLARIKMPIEFVLAAPRSISLARVKVVHASEIARAQCGRFIKIYLPHAKLLIHKRATSFSYTKVVQEVLVRGEVAERFVGKKFTAGGESENKTSAALGSLYGAKLYGLKILARHVQDIHDDETEFVLIRLPVLRKEGGRGMR